MVNKGLYQDPWKLATVTPIWEDGDRMDIENYRAISLLFYVSTVFEWLYSWENDFHLNQLGFRKARSAAIQLTVFFKCSIDSIGRSILLYCTWLRQGVRQATTQPTAPETGRVGLRRIFSKIHLLFRPWDALVRELEMILSCGFEMLSGTAGISNKKTSFCLL